MTFDEILDQLSSDVENLIDGLVQTTIDSAIEHPSFIEEWDEDVLLELLLLWRKAVEDIAVAVVDDVNKQTGDDIEGSIPQSDIDRHIDVGSLFLVEAVRRVVYMIHGANIAIQLDDDDQEKEEDARDDETKRVVISGKDNVNNISGGELALAFGLFTKSEQVARGILNYVWRTVGDSRVRPTHRSNEGVVFSWLSPSPITGHPKTQFGCRCSATPSTESVASVNNNETEFHTNNTGSTMTINKKKLPFNILSTTSNKLSINITGEIGDEWWDDSATYNTSSRVEEVLNDSLTEIDIFISSDGGSLAHGVAIYNLFKMHPAIINTYVMGHAHSAASLIFMSGDNRYMLDGGTSIIHNPWSCMCGDYQDGEKYAANMLKMAESIIDIYADGMNISREEIKGMLDREDVIIKADAMTIGYSTSLPPTDGGSINPNINNLIKNTVVGDDDVMRARGVIANNRQCELSTINTLNKTKDKVMSRDRINNSTDSDKLAELNAKLSIVEKSNTDLKSQNALLTIADEALKNKINDLEVTINKGVEDANLKVVKDKLASAGIKAEGETSEQLMQTVLAQFNVSDATKFKGDVLNSMFEYVLVQSDTSADNTYSLANSGIDDNGNTDIFEVTNKKIGGNK
jgi:SPP1 gp7 family putative phage head morphogenesis protein